MDEISGELKNLAKKVIEDNNMMWIELEQVEFVKRDKTSKSFADVRKVRYPTSLYMSKDFIISFYKGFEELNDSKKEIVMLHELLHIDPYDPEKLVKHDTEDFAVILEKHGVRWKSGGEQ